LGCSLSIALGAAATTSLLLFTSTVTGIATDPNFTTHFQLATAIGRKLCPGRGDT
jgi:hypothetical protein